MKPRIPNRKERRILLAMWYAKRAGYNKSVHGGWIYDLNGQPVTQSWITLYDKLREYIWMTLERIPND